MVRRITVGMLVLLLMPLMVWLTDWQWQPENHVIGLRFFYMLTETGSYPWSIVTTLCLLILFAYLLKLRMRQGIVLCLMVIMIMCVGQGIKTLIKKQTQEDRPYVVWLETRHHVSKSMFYNLSRWDRKEVIKQAVQDEQHIPHWLQRHWQKNNGYAFPSGHTTFAVTWALLAVGLLWPRRHYICVISLVLWASGVMGSRLLLGMHWPWDLMWGIVLGALLAGIGSYVVNKIWQLDLRQSQSTP